MSIKYNNIINDNSLTFAWGWDPQGKQREYRPRRHPLLVSENGPEGPPRRQRGDKYTRIGLVVGLIIGGVLGAVVAGSYFFFVGLLLGLAGGALAGAIIGAVIGGFIRKRRERTKNNAQEPF